MAPVRNAKVLFKAVPKTYPEPGKHIVYDDSEMIDLNAPLGGGILVKILAISSDPYMRERMRDPSEDVVSFVSPFQFNEPIDSFAIGRVLRSEAPSFSEGDHVYGLLPCQSYIQFDADSLRAVQQKAAPLQKLNMEKGVSVSAHLGVCGMPGQSAYIGWREFAKPKPGETVFVTAAGGSVGSFIIQLAKAAGCNVIASAGSEKKVDFARSVGADVVFNYKTTSTEEVLKKNGPIDIYWDNVGGETLGIVLSNTQYRGRIIVCGWISGYNTGYPPVCNVEQIFNRGLSVYGFIMANHIYLLEEFYKEIPSKVAKGEIKHREDIKQGLQGLPQALYDVQKGLNEGKSVVLLED